MACGCPKVYPLPGHVKVGVEVTCHHEHDLHLPKQLKDELAVLSDVSPEDFKITVVKGTVGTVTELDDRYVKVEFHTPGQPCEGPWFNELLRGDFAWYWCGTADAWVTSCLIVSREEDGR